MGNQKIQDKEVDTLWWKKKDLPIYNNNNNNFIYIALKSNNCPKRYLITK